METTFRLSPLALLLLVPAFALQACAAAGGADDGADSSNAAQTQSAAHADGWVSIRTTCTASDKGMPCGSDDRLGSCQFLATTNEASCIFPEAFCTPDTANHPCLRDSGELGLCQSYPAVPGATGADICAAAAGKAEGFVDVVTSCSPERAGSSCGRDGALGVCESYPAVPGATGADICAVPVDYCSPENEGATCLKNGAHGRCKSYPAVPGATGADVCNVD